MSKSRFGITLYRWHAWTGLISGVFLILICTTGAIAVFRPEIERAVDWNGKLDVVASGSQIGIERAIQVAQEKYPGSRATVARLPVIGGGTESHGDAYSITLNRGRGQRPLAVAVDPYRAEVIATLSPNAGWGNWLRQLHVRMLYGSFWGRYIVGLFGIVLLFSTVSGLFIFARFNANSWRPKFRRGRGARIALADLHKVVGLSSVAFNIIFGLTGAVLGLEGIYAKFIATRERPPKVSGVTGLPEGRLEALLERSKQLMPGCQPYELSIPSAQNGACKVMMMNPTGSLIKEMSSYVIFDAKSEKPVETYDARNAAIGVRAYYACEPLHFGRLGGAMWVKLLWAGMGLTGSFLSITGFAIFILRKRMPAVVRTPARKLPRFEPQAEELAPVH
jgi:uncharacterized iron-regulated membrane protein